MSTPQSQDVPPTMVPATLGAPADSLAPAAPAVHVPGYEVLAELGRGGMGVVYKAVQTALKRTVALKMILSGEYAGSSERGRFRTEAEAAARLSHPSIVQVFEVNEPHGLPYLSMELCEGGSLAERLRHGGLEPRQAAALVEALARAVHHAHQKGVIHRDLKPANVLLAGGDVPKITDFGLAKVLAGESNATQSGAVLGTPGYMAPEQAAGKSKAIGPAADVYALGAILYHCLTGRPPFAGNTAETLLAVLERQPDRPRTIDPHIDASLEAICLKCLEKAPEDRYPTALALADDLRAYLDGEAVLADAHTRLSLLRLLLHRSRHTEVLARWGRIWMIQGVLVVFFYLLETLLRWLSDGSPVLILANWALGLVAFLIPVWWLRLRSGVPFTLVDRQLAQLFFLHTVAMLLFAAVVAIKGITIRQVLGLDLVVVALGVGCGGLVLGGSLYPLALGCAAMSIVVACYPDMPPIVMGLVVGGGLFYAGWSVARDPAAGAPG